MDNWTTPLADHFQDPLLTAETLRELRNRDMIRIVREEREILALAALIPVTPSDVALAGIWVATGYDHMEMATAITSQAIDAAHRRSYTVIVPGQFLPYVNREVMTPKEAGRLLEDIMKSLSGAGVPRKHPLRHGGLKIVPAPAFPRDPAEIAFVVTFGREF